MTGDCKEKIETETDEALKNVHKTGTKRTKSHGEKLSPNSRTNQPRIGHTRGSERKSRPSHTNNTFRRHITKMCFNNRKTPPQPSRINIEQVPCSVSPTLYQNSDQPQTTGTHQNVVFPARWSKISTQCRHHKLHMHTKRNLQNPANNLHSHTHHPQKELHTILLYGPTSNTCTRTSFPTFLSFQSFFLPQELQDSTNSKQGTYEPYRPAIATPESNLEAPPCDENVFQESKNTAPALDNKT